MADTPRAQLAGFIAKYTPAIAKEGQSLKRVRPNRLRDYPMPPADLPLVAHLTTLL